MHFHYLASFICHLFADGNFRTVHIAFKPNIFNYTLLEHIDSVCPHSIPFYLTDITRPWVWPWNVKNDNPNNVLQLIFLDPKTFKKDTRQIEELFALYRIFVFSATDVAETKTQASIAKRLHKLSESNNLILTFDAKNVSIYIDLESKHPKPIFTMNKDSNFNLRNLFDQTFGQHERMLSIVVKNYDSDESFERIEETIQLHLNDNPIYYIANYFNLSFNKTYIHFTWLRPSGSQLIFVEFKLIPNQPKYYKELARTCKLIQSDNDPKPYPVP